MTWLRSIFARLFKPTYVHFHTMRPGDRVACGYTYGGVTEFTRDGVHRVTCPGCLAWLKEHPRYPLYHNSRDWLDGDKE